MRLLILILLLQTTAWASPWVVAHRGGTAIGPENVLSTFQRAASLGVEAVELDIHQSLDGQLMVIHDVTLDRTYGIPGRVDEMRYDELKVIGVPSLQEIVDGLDRRCRLVIEIKHPKEGRHQGIEERLLELMRLNDLLESAIVISFDRHSLKRLHDLDKRVVTGLLYSNSVSDFRALKRELGIRYLGPKYTLVSAQMVNQAHQAGLKVNTWTVDGREQLQNVMNFGCDAITTNQPDVMICLLSATSWFMPKSR